MPVIELDMLIAFVNRADRLHGIAVELFNMIVNGVLDNVAVPASAYMEYELVLRSRGYSEDDVSRDIEAFRHIKNLGEIPLTSGILVTASRIRMKHGLTYFDSLHAASALKHDRTIISTDKAYRAVPGLTVMDPRDVVRRASNTSSA